MSGAAGGPGGDLPGGPARAGVAPAPAGDAGPWATVVAWLGRRSRADLALHGAAAVCCVVALAGPPAWAALDPRLEATVAFLRGDALDPWGRPWRGTPLADPHGAAPPRVWSAGPDGRDERGEGDDVEVLLAGPGGGWRVRAWQALGDALLGAAIALGVGREVGRLAGRWLRGPWGGPVREAGVAAVAALPVAAVAAVAARVALPAAAAEAAPGPLPPWVTVGLSAWGALALGALGARARASAAAAEGGAGG